MKSRAPKPRTRQALWSVKQERPELFEQHERNLQEALKEDKKSACPPGFEPCAFSGWLYSSGQNAYFEKSTGRLCWRDGEVDDFLDLREGEEVPVTFVGGAASSAGQAAADAEAAGKVLHVAIPDMHRVAQALKIDWAHLDRPAAMVALFGTCAGQPGAAADVVARAFHERLIKRLGKFRSAWQDEHLCAAVAATLVDLAGAEGPAAIAFVLGDRLVAHASGGCRVCVPGAAERRDWGPTTLLRLTPELRELSTVLLSEMPATLDDAAVREAAGAQLQAGRPRAASVALLRAARAKGLEGRMAAASVRIAASGPPSSEPPAKKARTAPAPSKVRVRQILLLHWRGVGAKPMDPIRRKPVARSPEAAEVSMLAVLEGIAADAAAGFSAACKASSECQSALKGGDMIGDLGWLDRAAAEPAKPSGASAALKSVVPPAVRKAAFDLDVGELSDLVVSERGVHLLLRTA